MSFEEVAALSNSRNPQNVQHSVPAWLLSTQSRLEQEPRPPIPTTHMQDVEISNQKESWIPNQFSYTEIDQNSISSVDDSISLSDSAHESYSSESSSHTSYTSVTDSSDTFPDDECQDYLPQLTQVKSCPSAEPQEQALGGIQESEKATTSNKCGPCSIGNIIRRVKSQVSEYRKTSCSNNLQPSLQPCTRFRKGDASFGTGAQHWSSRRSASSTRPQPKLRRDTEGTEQFVALLIIFAKRLITAIWPLSDRPPMMTDCFNGAGVLPLEAFIKETLRRSKTSFSTLQVALYYLVLLRSRASPGSFGARCGGQNSERAQCRAMQCGRRMFLSALMLASKYLQDRNYSARAWSKISGLRSNEINENEREYLAQVNYDLHMPKYIFENWSKIVMVLSRLSNDGPSNSFNADYGSPGAGPSSSLAAMVSQMDADEAVDSEQHAFSDSWWTAILRKLEPSIVNQGDLTDSFLRKYLPSDKMHFVASLQHLSKQINAPQDCLPPSSNLITYGGDLTYSNPAISSSNLSKVQGVQTPQTTSVQTSPARSLELPSRPQLSNLPTPQTTPQIADQSSWEKISMQPSLRCASSIDAMRGLRKQCFLNANLERCPPPRPQNCSLPSMKYLMRAAGTSQEPVPRSTTPLAPSPASVSSESTTMSDSTSRSRSSSVSSMSSWSSWGQTMPHMRQSTACALSSPLARFCSLPDRTWKSISSTCQTTEPALQVEDQINEIGRQSSTESSTNGNYFAPNALLQIKHLASSSEVAAIHGLMSLSAQSETPSQCVTPTPQRLSTQDEVALSQRDNRPRDFKRKLSRTEASLQAEVKNILLDSAWSGDVEDPMLPYYGASYRQMQLPTSLRKENRRPVSTPTNNKRLCSLQCSSSTPATAHLPDRGDNNMLMCR